MAFLVTAQVQSESRFLEYEEAVTISVNKALVEWGAITLEKILSHETRVGTREHAGTISYGFPFKLHDPAGWRVAVAKVQGFGLLSSNIVVYTENPNALWQELGTRGSRRKSLKGGRGTPKKVGAVTSRVNDIGRGVSPLYFMRRGTREAYPIGIALVQAALAGLGELSSARRVFDTTSLFQTGSPPRPFADSDIVA